MKMRSNVPAVILSAAIVLAAVIYALASRYELVQTRSGIGDGTSYRAMVLDRWTGKTH